MLAISITSKTINPVQWSGPATRLGFAVLLGIILIGGFGFVANKVPKSGDRNRRGPAPWRSPSSCSPPCWSATA